MKKIIYILSGVILLVVLILIVSHSAKEEKPISIPEQIPSEEQKLEELQESYFVNFDISLEDRNFSLEGNTNLPNGSVLMIGIYRYIEYTELVGKRVADFDNNRIKVKDGKFTYSTYLTDKDWYKRELKENEILDIDFKKIYEDCYVSIIFTPAGNFQPKEVYQILGNNFENLNGEQVEEFAGFRVISFDKDFKLPIEEGIIIKSQK